MRLTRVSAALSLALLTLFAVVSLGTQATATQGSPAMAGESNTESKTTFFHHAIYGGSCEDNELAGVTGCGEEGVEGFGTLTGVRGLGDRTGVEANGGSMGVNAFGGDAGVYGAGPHRGIWGLATAPTATGVLGQASGGNGVSGISTNGVGVRAHAPIGSGIALKVGGGAEFSRSGLSSVLAGHSTKLISGVTLLPGSMVLATAQRDVAGVYVESAVPNPSNGTITIHLNKPVSVAYPVAWMVVEAP